LNSIDLRGLVLKLIKPGAWFSWWGCTSGEIAVALHLEPPSKERVDNGKEID